MKKVFVIAVFATLIYSCGSTKKAASTTAATTPTPTDQPAPPAIKQDNEAITAGNVVYTTKCGKCHGLKNTMDYTAERWGPIMDNMAAKARLTDIEKKNALAYVYANCKK